MEKPDESKVTGPVTVDLTPKQLRFVVEYFATGNATEAYRRAYDVTRMQATTVARNAHALLRNDKIATLVAQRKQEAITQASFGLKEAFAELVTVATADATELTAYRRLCCRHCWGVGNAYQWVDEDEYEAEYEAWTARQSAKRKTTRDPQPSDVGGYGFAFNERPNPECPRCRGEGKADAFFADTRFLSPAAKRLFRGVKVTKDGVQVLTRDPDAALDKIVRMLGGYKDTLVVHPGQPVDDAKSLPLDAQEASRLYAQRLKGSD